MRRPEPWYWAARKGWYVQINKKQVKLGADERGKNPTPEVMREYHRLMAVNGVLSEKDRRLSTVPEVCEAFLEAKSKMRTSTIDLYKRSLRRLCAGNMTRVFGTMRSSDLVKIAEATTEWGESTKCAFMKHSMTVFRWAREAGYTEFNAIVGEDNPYAIKARTRGLTDEEFQKLIGLSKGIEFRQIMLFLRGTGCRPSEARCVTAAHVHPNDPIVTLTPAEHKTGRRTKKNRVLYMPLEVNQIVRDLMRTHPVGPIFRNAHDGKGWGKAALWFRFKRYRDKLGLGGDVVPYLMRHAAATKWVNSGANLTHVAKALGHANISTLIQTYNHPDDETIAGFINKTDEFKDPAS